MTEISQAPESICKAISYRPVDGELFKMEARDTILDDLTGLELPDIVAGSLVLELIDGAVIFGSKDPDAVPHILAYFRKDDRSMVEVGDVHPKVLGSRTADQGPRLRYPFHTLEQIGEFFVVEEGNVQTVSTYASNYKKYMAPDKVFTIRDTKAGVIVMLVYSPTAIIRDSQRVSA